MTSWGHLQLVKHLGIPSKGLIGRGRVNNVSNPNKVRMKNPAAAVNLHVPKPLSEAGTTHFFKEQDNDN